MKIADQLVQLFVDSDADKVILTRSASPIIMRLYLGSPGYRRNILEIVRYMDEHLRSTFEDYAEPRGVAAPNLGFPLRIIGYRRKANENQFCLNPEITWKSPSTIITTTNCGSLQLKTPVQVERAATIDLSYFDLEGRSTQIKSITRGEGSFTIQNEVDQINGMTILDRCKKESEPDYSEAGD